MNLAHRFGIRTVQLIRFQPSPAYLERVLRIHWFRWEVEIHLRAWAPETHHG